MNMKIHSWEGAGRTGLPANGRRVALLGIMVAGLLVTAADAPARYPTPEAAAASLDLLAAAGDVPGIVAMFGAGGEGLVNPDPVEGAKELRDFATAYGAAHRLTATAPNRRVLEIGEDFIPFPVPLVEHDGWWVFDAAAGREEILNRRIGRNELAVLDVVRTYVTAQREYASRDRDGDSVLEYAQRIRSRPGQRDGLYWPPGDDLELSPLGPFVADAQAAGYRMPADAEGPRLPFHGYYFKVLTRQGPHAPGGSYNYVINGNMIGGFALVAWPAVYGETGVMTFVVNQQGVIYQKDLGQRTAAVARRMLRYDPDATWSPSPD